jgi:hypothetical protein
MQNLALSALCLSALVESRLSGGGPANRNLQSVASFYGDATWVGGANWGGGGGDQCGDVVERNDVSQAGVQLLRSWASSNPYRRDILVGSLPFCQQSNGRCRLAERYTLG